MGLRYFGPVDGHDVNHLVKILRDMKTINGPKLVHCITVKGKGLKQAEADQTTWHAPGKYNKDTGQLIKEQRVACDSFALERCCLQLTSTPRDCCNLP